MDCFTRDLSFRATKKKNVWSLSRLHAPDVEKKRSRGFLFGPYRGLFFFDVTALADRIRAPGFTAASLPLDRKRTLIWGYSPKGNNSTMAAVHFRAIVRFSDSGHMAFNEWSESLALDFTTIRVVTTTNARFDKDAFECPSLEIKGTQFQNCKTLEEVRNCKTALTIRSRIDHSSEVNVKDEQLTPAYYGIDEETIRQHVHHADMEAKAIARLRPPTPPGRPAPRYNSEQLDMAWAIGIPVVLLGVLLIVIRKT